MTSLRRGMELLQCAAASWLAHESPRLGAAVAFYTLIALSPMVSLVLSLLSLFIGRIAAQAQMIDRMHWLVGAEESRTVSFLLQSARQPFSGKLATLIGTSALLIGVSGLAGELRSGLNTIWSGERVRQSRSRVLFQDKSVALAMVLILLLLFTLSLLISASLVNMGKILAALLPLPGLVLRLASLAVSIGSSSLVFAFMFRWVPATRPSWRDVLVGAGLTGTLFYHRKASDGSVPDHIEFRNNIRRCEPIHPGYPLGVLLHTGLSFWGRVHVRVCQAKRQAGY